MPGSPGCLLGVGTIFPGAGLASGTVPEAHDGSGMLTLSSSGFMASASSWAASSSALSEEGRLSPRETVEVSETVRTLMGDSSWHQTAKLPRAVPGGAAPSMVRAPLGLLHTTIRGKHFQGPHMPYRAAGEQSTHSRVQLLPKGTTGTTMEGFHASSVHGRMGQHVPNPAGTLTGIVSLAPLTHLLCWEGWLHLSRGQPGTPGLPSFSCGAEGRTQSRFDVRSSGCIHQRYCQSSYHAPLQSTATHVVAKMSPKRCKRPFWSLPLPAPGSKWRG